MLNRRFFPAGSKDLRFRSKRIAPIGRLGVLVGLAVLVVCSSPNARAQNWASTATKAYPVQYLSNATDLGSLPSSTPMHIVVGLQEQNAGQVQPTLQAMLTPGNPQYGKPLTVQQFVAQFGATTAQVQAVENYLSGAGFTNVTVADNQLLVEADGTAGAVEAAFNTKLEQYSVNGSTVYLNTAAAQVPASLSSIVIAVLGLNNIARLHSHSTTLQTGPQTDPCNPPTSCPTPDVNNETFTPQQYQIAYHAASPDPPAAAGTANSASASTTTISGSMEGNLIVRPGDTIRTGYDFSMPGNHTGATVMVSNGMVTLKVLCSDSSAQTLTISLPNQTYTVGPNNDSWYPSGDQKSSLVYQGSTMAPSNLCGGKQGHAPDGAIFTATFQSNDTTDPVNVRFHYSDNTAGSWSATVPANLTFTSGGGGSGPCSNRFAAPQLLSTGQCTAVGIISEGDLGTVSPQNPESGTPSAASTGVIHDLYLFEQAYKLPAVPVTIVHAGIPSPDTSGAGEWDLDSQSSTGIAQQVAHLYFYVATSLTDSDIGLAINKAVSENQVKAFNMSFGECEAFPYADGAMLLDDEMFGEAALQGITPFASSDDNGSACPIGIPNGVPLSGPPDTSYPASSPYVIAVGGTNLFTNTNYTYDFEVAWEASGGGPSYFETPPFWQAYTGSGTLPIVPSAAVNSEVGCPSGCRGVPDVSMCAGGTELAICAALTYVNGTTELIGGTSLSSPLSMGAWARIETSHNNDLGFAGPLLYQLANGLPTTDPGSLSPFFNDVWTGSNGLFSASPGWDFVTGLGSWDILVVNLHIPTTYPH